MSIVHSNSSTTAQPSTKCKRDKHCDLMRRRDNVFGLPSQHASQELPDTPSEHFSASSHCHASQDGDWDALASRVKTASQGPRFALSEHDCQTYCEHRPTRRHPPACAPHPANGVQSGPNPGHWWFLDHWFGTRTAGRANLDFHMNCGFWSLVRTNSFCNLSAKTHRTKPKKQCRTASSRTSL